MISALITFLVYAFVIGLLLWLLQFVLANFPIVEPFRRIIWVVAVVIAVLVLIVLLLDMFGGGNMGLPRLRMSIEWAMVMLIFMAVALVAAIWMYDR